MELDFIHEARNCEKVSKCFAHLHFLKVTALYLDQQHSLSPFSDLQVPSCFGCLYVYLFYYVLSYIC